MTKQTLTFNQWFNHLSEWMDSKDIATHFDFLTMLYHSGASVFDAVSEVVIETH